MLSKKLVSARAETTTSSEKNSTYTTKTLAASLALCLLIGNVCPLPALSWWSIASPKKSSNLQVPGFEKLSTGSGPAGASSTSNRSASGTQSYIAPINLGATTPSNSQPADDPANSRLNATISATGFVPKGPIDRNGKAFDKPASIKSGTLGGSLLSKATSVNAMPLPLIKTAEEAQQDMEMTETAETVQLKDLWDSTLTKSPDIQFVVQKLMPTSNQGKAASIMSKMLGSALFGAMGAVSMMAPSMGTFVGTNAGASMIMQLLSLQDSKAQKRAALSQTEAIMLYNMVRTVADKMVGNYRDYKMKISKSERAENNLKDLQSMVAEARQGQDAAKQIEMEYTIKKAQLDCDELIDEVKKYRQCLVDLAGQDAVCKLDKQIDDERLAKQGICETPTTISPVPEATPPGATAQKPEKKSEQTAQKVKEKKGVDI